MLFAVASVLSWLAGAPDGVRLVDNNNGTFTAFIDVDSSGTYLPWMHLASL